MLERNNKQIALANNPPPYEKVEKTEEKKSIEIANKEKTKSTDFEIKNELRKKLVNDLNYLYIKLKILIKKLKSPQFRAEHQNHKKKLKKLFLEQEESTEVIDQDFSSAFQLEIINQYHQYLLDYDLLQEIILRDNFLTTTNIANIKKDIKLACNKLNTDAYALKKLRYFGDRQIEHFQEVSLCSSRLEKKRTNLGFQIIQVEHEYKKPWVSEDVGCCFCLGFFIIVTGIIPLGLICLSINLISLIIKNYGVYSRETEINMIDEQLRQLPLKDTQSLNELMGLPTKLPGDKNQTILPKADADPYYADRLQQGLFKFHKIAAKIEFKASTYPRMRIT